MLPQSNPLSRSSPEIKSNRDVPRKRKGATSVDSISSNDRWDITKPKEKVKETTGHSYNERFQRDVILVLIRGLLLEDIDKDFSPQKGIFVQLSFGKQVQFAQPERGYRYKKRFPKERLFLQRYDWQLRISRIVQYRKGVQRKKFIYQKIFQGITGDRDSSDEINFDIIGRMIGETPISEAMLVLGGIEMLGYRSENGKDFYPYAPYIIK